VTSTAAPASTARDPTTSGQSLERQGFTADEFVRAYREARNLRQIYQEMALFSRSMVATVAVAPYLGPVQGGLGLSLTF